MLISDIIKLTIWKLLALFETRGIWTVNQICTYRIVFLFLRGKETANKPKANLSRRHSVRVASNDSLFYDLVVNQCHKIILMSLSLLVFVAFIKQLQVWRKKRQMTDSTMSVAFLTRNICLWCEKCSFPLLYCWMKKKNRDDGAVCVKTLKIAPCRS